MKSSGISRPEVEARAPNVKVFPAMAFGKSVSGFSPVAALAMRSVLNAASSAPCAIAWALGTALRAWTPVTAAG